MDERQGGLDLWEHRLLQAVLDVWGRLGGEHWLPIMGRSMWPLIQEGDEVLVAHGDRAMRRGDVAVCRRWDRLVLHRVLRIDRRECGTVVITKGDNAACCDAPWGADEVVGRVRAVKRADRLISLETTGWRTTGWLIAMVTLTWMECDRSSRGLKQRLLGPQPNRFAAILRRSALALSVLALNGMHMLFWRGKP